MHGVSLRHAVLLAVVAMLLGCVGPHEIDESPLSGSEREERSGDEVEAQEPDDSDSEQEADEEEPEREPSNRR